eukprot:5513793-Amphidinium_carterae.1
MSLKSKACFAYVKAVAMRPVHALRGPEGLVLEPAHIFQELTAAWDQHWWVSDPHCDDCHSM